MAHLTSLMINGKARFDYRFWCKSCEIADKPLTTLDIVSETIENNEDNYSDVVSTKHMKLYMAYLRGQTLEDTGWYD